jgi:hypothetical protein
MRATPGTWRWTRRRWRRISTRWLSTSPATPALIRKRAWQPAGCVLSREQLLAALKGDAFDPFDRSIDVHIGRLRVAIEDDVKLPRRIITVRGAGYVFAKVHDA